MELQNPPTQFNFPNVQPNSPPATPNSKQTRNTSTSYYSMNRRKHHGIANFGLSPPEHIAPRGLGHQFSYTPPNKDRPSSDSASESEVADSEASIHSKGKAPAPVSDRSNDPPERRPSVIRPIDEDTDFTVEEISDDDIGHDDLDVLFPDQTEDARSDQGSKKSERDIIDALKELHCGEKEEQERAQKFEMAQREAYQKRKKRWSVGGYKKRSHTQSVGSQSSGHEDIEPLDDDHGPGAAARRLRRRTQGPEDAQRPARGSLLFDDPPKELEELAVEDEPPPLPSDSDGDLWSEDEDEDGIEEIELLLPHWLMELESNPPSRPSTAVSIGSVRSRPLTPVRPPVARTYASVLASASASTGGVLPQNA